MIFIPKGERTICRTKKIKNFLDPENTRFLGHIKAKLCLSFKIIILIEHFGDFLKIEKVTLKDAKVINEVINEYFPYTFFTVEDISDKIGEENFFIIKAHQRNIFLGFAEVEFFKEKNEARLNAIFVESAWRGQKVATKIVKKIIHECKRKRIHRLFLLVKESNLAAKKLYKNAGFEFEKIHNKIIEGSKIEVWVTKLK